MKLKRRGFLKALGFVAAAPIAAKLVDVSPAADYTEVHNAARTVGKTKMSALVGSPSDPLGLLDTVTVRTVVRRDLKRSITFEDVQMSRADAEILRAEQKRKRLDLVSTRAVTEGTVPTAAAIRALRQS